MKMNKAALALAIASSFGAMSAAQAAIDLTDSTTALKVAKEISLQNVGPFLNNANGAGATKDRLTVKVPALKGYVTNSNNTYFVKIALLDGATFNGKAKLQCASGGAGAGIIAADLIKNGNKGDSVATFSIATGHTLSAACTVMVSGGDASATMSGYYDITDKVDQRMSALIEYKEGLTNKNTATVGTFITFVDALAVSASTNTVTGGAANAIISVQDASLKFVADKIASQTTAFVGTVAYNTANNTAVYNPLNNASSASVTATNIVATAAVTIDSPSLAGAVSVDLVEDTATSGCAGTSVSSQPTNGGTSVTFTNVNLSQLQAGLSVCVTIDGTTSVPAGQFTATVTGTGTGTNNDETVPNFGTPQINLYKLVKNGSAHRVLNIPPAGVADQAFIRLYNVSSFAGTVLGTMRDSTGALIGTAGTVVTTLNPREVKVVNADTLKTLFGDWTGRSRLFLEADIDQLRVQSLMRSSDVLENMSGQAVD
jgi:hypothetical protein